MNFKPNVILSYFNIMDYAKIIDDNYLIFEGILYVIKVDCQDIGNVGELETSPLKTLLHEINDKKELSITSIKYLCNPVIDPETGIRSAKTIANACKMGKIKLVEWVITNLEICGDELDKIVMILSKYGHLDLLKILSDKYGHERIRSTDLIPIKLALKNSRLDVAKYLMEICPVNSRSEVMDLFIYAIMSESIEVYDYIDSHICDDDEKKVQQGHQFLFSPDDKYTSCLMKCEDVDFVRYVLSKRDLKMRDGSAINFDDLKKNKVIYDYCQDIDYFSPDKSSSEEHGKINKDEATDAHNYMEQFGELTHEYYQNVQENGWNVNLFTLFLSPTHPSIYDDEDFYFEVIHSICERANSKTVKYIADFSLFTIRGMSEEMLLSNAYWNDNICMLEYLFESKLVDMDSPHILIYDLYDKENCHKQHHKLSTFKYLIKKLNMESKFGVKNIFNIEAGIHYSSYVHYVVKHACYYQDLEYLKYVVELTPKSRIRKLLEDGIIVDVIIYVLFMENYEMVKYLLDVMGPDYNKFLFNQSSEIFPRCCLTRRTSLFIFLYESLNSYGFDSNNESYILKKINAIASAIICDSTDIFKYILDTLSKEREDFISRLIFYLTDDKSNDYHYIYEIFRDDVHASVGSRRYIRNIDPNNKCMKMLKDKYPHYF